MAELNLKQIEDKLNSEFTGDSRKIVFWYDDKGDFKDDIESLNLENAKVHYLNKTNLFKTKLVLEREDTHSNYLIYAPFSKPISRDNHLADTIKYSKEFFADRISLIISDLNMGEECRPVLQKYSTFFGARGNKGRISKFYDIEVDTYNEDTIEIALLSILSKSKLANFEEVVRIVLTSGNLSENEYLNGFKKYGLDKAFWKLISHTFSYADEEASLEKFIISLFLTYAEKEIHGELPSQLNKYLLSKSGTVMTFMDQMMNNILYRDKFDLLSDKVFTSINGEKLFDDFEVDALIDLDIFKFVDEKIIKWIITVLLDENLNATINGMDISQICKHREKRHFGANYFNEYHLLKHGFYVISKVNYKPESDVISIIEKYDKEDYLIDTHYRKFYYYSDKIKEQHIFEELRDLVENIYTNKYLDVLTHEFNSKFTYDDVSGKYRLQRDFYKRFVETSKEMLVVIISDGLRYEVAKELVKQMERNKKVDKVEIQPLMGVIPSETSLGMASLLPHKELTMDENYNVFVDGRPCSNLIQRDEILKLGNSDSASIQYDDLTKYKQEEWNNFFVGKSVVYIYHNQIDARGDKLNTEDEVFNACKEAIDEIEDLIIYLTNRVSRIKYIVTADHGFIYKRNKTTESDKIDNSFSKDDQVNKRYIVTENDYEVTGTKNLLMTEVLDSYDTRKITVPMASNIFKSAGGGQNYVHGGSSPQEILIPVIQVKTIKGHVKSENAKIALISMLPTITSLLINLDFIQQQPISDVVLPTTYKISFIDDEGQVISNENVHLANNKEKESAKRIFKLRFKLKDQKYKRDKKYYLVATDKKTGMEAFRHEVLIDIAFADDFGFDI